MLEPSRSIPAAGPRVLPFRRITPVEHAPAGQSRRAFAVGAILYEYLTGRPPFRAGGGGLLGGVGGDATQLDDVLFSLIAREVSGIESGLTGLLGGLRGPSNPAPTPTQRSKGGAACGWCGLTGRMQAVGHALTLSNLTASL
jgi:hypothetical protein